GALLALLLLRIELTIMALIGIILLIGIVKKNAILMIDFAIAAERDERRNPSDAIYQACILRFRPIMMTTMAALLGALPLALGTGTGSELRRPLGVAIIGGLIFSQMLTLYTTPVVYLYLDRLALRLRSRRQGTTNRIQEAPGNYHLLLVPLIFVFLSGCTVGPRYTTPTAPIPPAFKEPDNWKYAVPQDALPRGKWWEIFGDSELNALEAQVNISNQDIAGAEARFRSARAAIRVAKADLFPTVSIGTNVTVFRFPSERATIPGINANTGTFYQLPIDVSYEADVWGRVRRNIQSNVDSAQASAADVETVRLSVHSELALDYFQLRGLDAQQHIFQDSI